MIGPVTCRIRKCGGRDEQIVHVNRLKIYTAVPQYVNVAPDENSSGLSSEEEETDVHSESEENSCSMNQQLSYEGQVVLGGLLTVGPIRYPTKGIYGMSINGQNLSTFFLISGISYFRDQDFFFEKKTVRKIFQLGSVGYTLVR
ncbi:hypothetical protein JTB14_008947 [Gonioctena quinquepunctata]|nr:hypothetical protein JTB14_008947 [Gonioctena quinquepunctata]